MRLWFTFLCALGLFSPLTYAERLLIAPMRVIFEPKDQARTINLTNQRQTPMRYTLDLLNYTMNERGMLVQMAEDNPLAASRMLRFMPQTFTLDPGARQTVRLLLRRTSDLAPGEYYSHLLIREELVNQAASSTTEVIEEGKASFGVYTALENVIPLIVRHGKVSSSLVFDMTGPLTSSSSSLVVPFKRTGNIGANAHVRIVTPAGDEITKPRMLRLYRAHEAFQIPLQWAEGKASYQGPALIIIRESPQTNAPILQQAALTIPPPDSD